MVGVTVAASVAGGTHTLYYIFSDQTAQQTITPYSTNTTIIIPAQRSQWNTVRISPESIWRAQGWTMPQQVTFSIFLQSDSAGVYYTSFDNIIPT